MAVGDLYYIYQHERIGVFRVVQKLQELFQGRRVRLSGGAGRLRALPVRPPRGAALHRATTGSPPTAGCSATARGLGAARQPAQHRLPHAVRHFVNQVTLFWRDKRISDVIRERAYDPSFGVDRHRPPGRARPAQQPQVDVLRPPERDAGRGDAAARRGVPHPGRRGHQGLFGADNAWDVVEEVLIRYFDERLVTSPRQRMARRRAARSCAGWRQPHILQTRPRAVRGAAAGDRGVRRGVAHDGAGDGPGPAHGHGPGACRGTRWARRRRRSVRRAVARADAARRPAAARSTRGATAWVPTAAGRAESPPVRFGERWPPPRCSPPPGGGERTG